jgi:replicative DNA helicase
MNGNGFSLLDIERAAVSVMMQWPKCIDEAKARKITPEYFTHPSMRRLFELVCGQWEEGQPLDLILFTDKMRKSGEIDNIGGHALLTETWTACHSSDVFPYYLERLEDQYVETAVTKACKVTQERATGGTVTGAELKHFLLQEIITLPEPGQLRPERTLREAVQDKLARMERGEPDEDIIKTGLTKLDSNSPLRRGDMPLIAGAAKVGKSTLALTIATNVARNGTPVVIFSLEDREPKVVDRLFAGLSKIPMRDHHVGKLTPDQIQLATQAAGKLGELPIAIKDDIFDLDQIIAAARQLNARSAAGLMIIDYAQLVRTPTSKDRNREQEVARVSRELRLLAMETNVPIIVLVQLNEDGRTRESRALEQDATAMWLLKELDEGDPNTRLLEIPWQRNGESGIDFPLRFFGTIARLENCAQPEKWAANRGSV